MINLLLAVACSAAISLAIRASENRIRSQVAMFAVNYIFCLLIAMLRTGPSRLIPTGAGAAVAIGVGVTNGVLYLLNFLLLQWNVRRNGVVLASAFMKLGVLVPTVLSILLFHERPGLAQTAGLLLALAAIVTLNFEPGGSTQAAGSGLGLILLLLAGGITDTLAKVYAQYGNPALEGSYLLFTFGTALVLCGLLLISKRQRVGRAEVLFGLLVGLPNYFSALFLLRAVGRLPAVVIYPSYSVGTILLVTLAGLLVFREKLSRRQLVGGAAILAALALLNL